MINHYECDVAIKALLAEKTILFPTDTVWSVGCLPDAAEAIEQMFHLKNDNRSEHFEVLFDSLARLKNFVPLLHPKIETLLAFHERPLTVVIQSPHLLPGSIQDQRGTVSVRIVQDALSKHLIRQVNAPIVSVAASAANEPYPVNFGTIRSDFIQGVDYVMKMRQKDLAGQAKPSVKVKLDEQEDFVFLRE